jgi:hypothetical protein
LVLLLLLLAVPKKLALFCCVLCRFEGSSLSLKLSCLLKGEWLASWENPLKEPCLSSILVGAWGLSMAFVATTGAARDAAEDEVLTLSMEPEKDFPPPLPFDPSESVKDVTRKLPDLVKVDVLLSYVIVTPHSFSRFCFLSRQTAKAHPTAWLSLSPCWTPENMQTLYWDYQTQKSSSSLFFSPH